MMIRGLFAAVALSIGSVDIVSGCDSPHSRHEDMGRVSNQLQIADKQLNETYQLLLSRLNSAQGSS